MEREGRWIDEALASLAERARHSSTVQVEIGVLAARLFAATASLEPLKARLSRAALSADEGSARVDGALAALRAQELEATQALQAYAATAREIARLNPR